MGIDGYFDDNGRWCKRNYICTNDWLHKHNLYTTSDQFYYSEFLTKKLFPSKDKFNYKFRWFTCIFIDGHLYVIVSTKMYDITKDQWTNYIMKYEQFISYLENTLQKQVCDIYTYELPSELGYIRILFYFPQ